MSVDERGEVVVGERESRLEGGGGREEECEVCAGIRERISDLAQVRGGAGRTELVVEVSNKGESALDGVPVGDVEVRDGLGKILGLSLWHQKTHEPSSEL